MDSITPRDLVRALKQLLPPLDPDTVNFGSVMEDLARHFGVSRGELKAKYKEELMQMIPDMVHLCKGGEDKENVPESEDSDEEEAGPRKAKPAKRGRRIQESDDEDDDDGEDEMDQEESEDNASEGDSEEEEERAPKRRKKISPSKKSKPAPAARKTPAPRKPVEKSKDSEGMAALKELARVAGLLSPAVYATLKKLNSEEEQEGVLRERLQDAGVRFSGSYPKKSDIAAAKRKRDKEKELDGIDTSLIITGGRSRRSSAQVSYVATYDDEDDEEGDGVEKNEDEEELHDLNEEESEAHEEGSEASDDSEAEF